MIMHKVLQGEILYESLLKRKLLRHPLHQDWLFREKSFESQGIFWKDPSEKSI